MRSEEEVRAMLNLFENDYPKLQGTFTVHAVRAVLKLILEINCDEDISIMEGLVWQNKKE